MSKICELLNISYKITTLRTHKQYQYIIFAIPELSKFLFHVIIDETKAKKIIYFVQ